MASADIARINPLTIAGLGKALTSADMAVSRTTYNHLPHIRDQDKAMEGFTKHLRAVIAIIARYNMGANFRPHIAHRHDLLTGGKVRLESPIDGTSFKLTKPADISKLDFNNIHPTCFKVIGTNIVGFEFAKGPVPLTACKIPTAFLEEWSGYLNEHNLADLLTLDFGQFDTGIEATSEMELQLGDTSATLVVPLSATPGEGIEQVPTSWVVRAPRVVSPGARDSSPDQPAPGTHWAKRVNDLTHKVYTNSNPAEVGTDEQLLDALTMAGILIAV